MFPWRYLHSLEEVKKQTDNILNYLVLLTLLWACTMFDLLMISIFGVYCYYLHPRKHIYRKEISKTHNKYEPTLKFVANSLLEILQLFILIFCMPFKWS